MKAILTNSRRKPKRAKRTNGKAAKIANGPVEGQVVPRKAHAFNRARVRHHKRTRFNPIKNLTPERLSGQLDRAWEGDLRDLALTYDFIERRDDMVRAVASKRKGAAAATDWQILIRDGIEPGQEAEAELHKEALHFFYDNLDATHAIDLDLHGGFSLLVRQMMDAVGKKWAVHEVIWQPEIVGGKHLLTACFQFVPLWFFENRTGKLQFLESDYAIDGRPLEPGGWMISTSEGVMEATSVAYIYKQLALKDWTIFSQDFGRPYIHGKTAAAKDSSDWDDLQEAVEDLSSDLRILTDPDTSIEITPVTGGTGDLTFPKLTDRQDRRIAALWRGADLSTMSAGPGKGQGASLQGEETEKIEEDDAAFISETLQLQIDQLVIEYIFGEGTRPLAYIKLVKPPKVDVQREIEIDKHLTDHGAPVGVKDSMERFGRSLPGDGEDVLQKSQGAPSGAALSGGVGGRIFGNQATLDQQALDKMAEAVAQDLAPIRTRLASIVEIEDETIFRTRLMDFLGELDRISKDINADPQSGSVLSNVIATMLANTMESAKKRLEVPA